MPGKTDEPGADDKTTTTDSALFASVREAGQLAQQDRQRQDQQQDQQDEQREVDEQEGQSPT